MAQADGIGAEAAPQLSLSASVSRSGKASWGVLKLARWAGRGGRLFSRNHVVLGGGAHVGVDRHMRLCRRLFNSALERCGSAHINRGVGLRLPRGRLGHFGKRSVDQLDLALGQPFVRSGGGQRAELRPVSRFAVLVLGPDLQDLEEGAPGFLRARQSTTTGAGPFHFRNQLASCVIGNKQLTDGEHTTNAGRSIKMPPPPTGSGAGAVLSVRELAGKFRGGAGCGSCGFSLLCASQTRQGRRARVQGQRGRAGTL